MTIEERINIAQNGDNAEMERLIEENSGLIWSVARRFMGRGVDNDDLYQLGSIGFLKAVRGFSTEYGTQFSTYAVPKIAGEIRRFLRDDGAVKVSRTLKERSSKTATARAELTRKLGREPHLSELAEYCGITVEEIADADIASNNLVESMQATSGDGSCSLETFLGVESHEERILEEMTLRSAVDKLGEKERQVILLRYYKGLTQQSTARVLDISQVQVSRIERKAIASLKNYLRD